MILIHLGVIDAPSRPGVEVVREPQDYTDARLAVREARRAGTDLDVFVLNSVCYHWFWDLYGYPDVNISEEDPTSLLCKKLRISTLPPEIADPQIISDLQLQD